MTNTSDFVKINVSNSKNDSVAFEVKFAKSLTVAELKLKLELITGGCAGTMQLQLFDADRMVLAITDNTQRVEQLPIENGMRLHVIDSFASISDENVEKFELTDDQYEGKNDTVRNFLKMNRLGKYNAEEMEKLEMKRKQEEEEKLRRAELCTIGSRCQISVPGNPIRRGTVMYNGALDGKKGIFIGVKYDEPLGKNDGSFNGKSYFVCPPNYGGFVSPLSVEVGDFPVEPCELDDEI